MDNKITKKTEKEKSKTKKSKTENKKNKEKPYYQRVRTGDQVAFINVTSPQETTSHKTSRTGSTMDITNLLNSSSSEKKRKLNETDTVSTPIPHTPEQQPRIPPPLPLSSTNLSTTQTQSVSDALGIPNELYAELLHGQEQYFKNAEQQLYTNPNFIAQQYLIAQQQQQNLYDQQQFPVPEFYTQQPQYTQTQSHFLTIEVFNELMSKINDLQLAVVGLNQEVAQLKQQQLELQQQLYIATATTLTPRPYAYIPPIPPTQRPQASQPSQPPQTQNPAPSRKMTTRLASKQPSISQKEKEETSYSP